MNIYLLVEGNTEKKLYQAWFNYLLPALKKVNLYNEVSQNSYYLISGEGYPNILEYGIPNAVDKIQEVGKYNYLVICLDADEDQVDEREQEIWDFIETEKINLGDTKIIPIIQNRCIETWLLGNSKMFNSRQPMDKTLSNYAKYYDVSQHDPELMGHYNDQFNHATFHFNYLREIFRAKNTTYSKTDPGDAKEKYYLEELLSRVKNDPKHLKTFQSFINFCDRIKQEII